MSRTDALMLKSAPGNDHDRDPGAPHHLFGHAAQQKLLDARAPNHAHDYDIHSLLLCEPDDLAAWIALHHHALIGHCHLFGYYLYLRQGLFALLEQELADAEQQHIVRQMGCAAGVRHV